MFAAAGWRLLRSGGTSDATALQTGGVYPEPVFDSTITDDDIAVAAKNFVGSLALGADRAIHCFDEGAMAAKMLAGLPRGSIADQNAMDARVREALAGGRDAMRQTFSLASKARFLRVQRIGGSPRAVLSILFANSRDYLLLEPVRSRKGWIAFADFTLLSIGRPVVETAKHLLYQAGTIEVGGNAPSSAERQRRLEALKLLGNASISAKAGNLAEALRLVRRIPAEFADEQVFLRVRLNMLVASDDPECEEAFKKYVALYPSDPTVHFVRYGHCSRKKNYKEASEAAKATAALIGRTPDLEYAEAMRILSTGDWHGAEKVAASAVEADDSLTEVYWLLVVIATRDRRFADAVRRLDEIHRCDPAGSIPPDMEAYAPLKRSKEYLDWLARRKSQR